MSSSERAPRRPSAPSRSSSPATSGRATSTKSCAPEASAASDQKPLCSARFTAFRSTAPPTLRLTETPRRMSSPSVSPSRAGRCRDQEAVGVRLALAIDAVEVAAARQAPTLAPLARRAGAHGVSRLRPLRRRRLMTCAAAARAHAGAEPVGAGALSLLGLIGPLHDRRGSIGGASSVPGRAAGWAPRLFRAGCGLGLRSRRGGSRTRFYDRPPMPEDTLHDDLGSIWEGVTEDLRASLPASTFDLWLEPLRPVSAAGHGPSARRTAIDPGLGRAALPRHAARRPSGPSAAASSTSLIVEEGAESTTPGSTQADGAPSNPSTSTRATPSSAS